jgi:hypothetical protein
VRHPKSKKVPKQPKALQFDTVQLISGPIVTAPFVQYVGPEERVAAFFGAQ